MGGASRGRPNYPTFVTSWPQFVRAFGDVTKDHHMPLAVFHFFLNGGRRAYIIRVLSKDAKPSTEKLKVGDKDVTINAAGGGKWGDSIKLTVKANSLDATRFDWTIEVGGETVEAFPSMGTTESGEKFYAALINRDSNYIRIQPGADGNFAEGAPAAFDKNLAGGDDGPAVTAPDYTAAALEIDRLDDASILVIPGASKDIASVGIDYAHGRLLGDMIYIMDSEGSPRDDRSSSTQISQVKDLLKGLPNKSSYAALYFPWVEVSDPYSRVAGATRFAPPSGMIAGLYARTDNTRGVWKAPAGTEAVLLGTVGVAAGVTDSDQDALNPIGINCIRAFPASGIVVWGSRTLATQSNPEYRYVPIRRMASFLKKSLFRGTQWVVFEPNDEPLWSAIRFNINAFMLTQFRSGAFQGGKPADAFFVKCDGENNIQATIDAGQVHILVAFAPLKPAEFVIIHIQQVRKE
jgi:phage tail sheath protein FI